MNRKNSVILLVISFFVFSCGEQSSTGGQGSVFDVQGENGFVGKVTGTNAFIALLIADDKAIVYVCNGDEEIAEWFKGPITDPNNISLTNSDGAQISGKFDGSSFAGTVTLKNASTHSFTASPNTGDETGIFRVHGDLATQEGVVAGWIVNSESDDRGTLSLRGVFQATPRFRELSDGTSNTLQFQFNRLSFPVERFLIKRSGSSSSIVHMNG